MKPTILITGGNSFLAQNFKPYLKKKYKVLCPPRTELDVTDFDALEKYIEIGKPSIVIHTALVGGRRLREDTHHDYIINTSMLVNLVKLKNKYDKLVVFGSGAEFTSNENNYFYSLAKVKQHKMLESIPNVLNLRIWNCFGENEATNRFIKASISNYINKKDIEIWENRFFDFFYINDLCYVLANELEKPPHPYKVINCVYEKKYKFTDVAAIINKLSDYEVPVMVKDDTENHYAAQNRSVGYTNLIGLEQGIRNIYNFLLKNNALAT